ncbi:MAG: hypothetical protein H0V29_11085 [Thermoleophilaceae bacterium]|nr:hypothetical protein [Thermoleophilaceae bacterium]
MEGALRRLYGRMGSRYLRTYRIIYLGTSGLSAILAAVIFREYVEMSNAELLG